ncbi:MAG: hypothetical protein GX256_10165 [Fretibacterium sp.]|nr:hypothetical protein [Fretibacterium sp.]
MLSAVSGRRHPANAFEMLRATQIVTSNVLYVIFGSWFAVPSALHEAQG